MRFDLLLPVLIIIPGKRQPLVFYSQFPIRNRITAMEDLIHQFHTLSGANLRPLQGGWTTYLIRHDIWFRNEQTVETMMWLLAVISTSPMHRVTEITILPFSFRGFCPLIKAHYSTSAIYMNGHKPFPPRNFKAAYVRCSVRESVTQWLVFALYRNL